MDHTATHTADRQTLKNLMRPKKKGWVYVGAIGAAIVLIALALSAIMLPILIFNHL